MNSVGKILALVVGIVLLVVALQWMRQDNDAENVVEDGVDEAGDLLRDGADAVQDAADDVKDAVR